MQGEETIVMPAGSADRYATVMASVAERKAAVAARRTATTMAWRDVLMSGAGDKGQ